MQYVTATTSLSISGTTISNSTTTGALQVAGGVGIGGDLNVGGNITANKLTIQYTTITTTLVTTDDIITTSNTTTATSTTTGALQIAGGAGIGGNVYVAGTIFSNGSRVIPLNIQEFTATASQTTFTVSGGYTVGTVQVFANGIQLGSADLTASNGTTVVLAIPRKVDDIIRIISGGTISSLNNANNFATAMSVAMSM